MIIQQVELENYRSHQKTTIDFSPGINLILGMNGSGKSSILEAISMVLFSITDRTGKQTGKEFIRHGEKTSRVAITLFANDGRIYLVESKFHTKKPMVLSLIDVETKEEYEGNVQEKIQELCGIKAEYKNLYEHMIIAKQNEFISIFKETPRKREEVFHKIFNTEIYTNMYGSIWKEIEERYRKEKETLLLEKNILASKLPDDTKLLEEYQEEMKKERMLEIQWKELSQKKEESQKKLYGYQEKKRKYEEYKKQIEEQIIAIQEKRFDVKAKFQERRKAKEARQKVEETEKEYLEYDIVWKQLEVVQQELKVLKAQEEKNQSLLIQNEKLLWDIEQKKEEWKVLEKEIFDNQKEEKQQQEEYQGILEQEKHWKQKEEEYKKIKAELQVKKETSNSIEKNRYSLEETIHAEKRKIQQKIDSLQEIPKDEIFSHLGEIEKIKGIVEKVKQEKTVLSEKKLVLLEAQEKLGSKVCPLLQESCLNVEDKDVVSYFTFKIDSLEQQMQELEEKIVYKEKLLKQENEYREMLQRAIFLEKELEEEQRHLKELEIEEKQKKLEYDRYIFSMQEMLYHFSFKDQKELEKTLEETIRRISSFHVEEKKKNLEKLAGLQKRYIEKRKFLREDIEKKEEQQIKNKEEIDDSILKKIQDKEEEIQILSQRQQELKNSHHIYLEYIQLSQKLDVISQGIRDLLVKIIREKKKQKERVLQKELLEKEIGTISIEQLEQEYQVSEKNLLELSRVLGTIKEKRQQLEERIELFQREKLKIQELETKLLRIGNKLQKTILTRNQVKTMGLKISNYMLETLSYVASKNFQKLTASAETILWSNEDKDKYEVYLVGGENITPFRDLSGGEQVIVAIALRQSLTEYFSNAKFMILDEPTNNLDRERKKLLAEYMAEMLSSFEQSIIVTHDSTFREMAERVIEL